MGLSWQQSPLSPGVIGRFLTAETLPQRLLYAEPLRRRMRVSFGGIRIADEPGRYPGAYFPENEVSPDALKRKDHTTWQRIDLPSYASALQRRVAFAWPAVDALYEEAADSYRRLVGPDRGLDIG